MGRVPVDLRKNIAANIRNCRCRKYPMWGGAKKCAEAFGVTPQQWSQWERGAHMPDEYRMIQLGLFFNVSTEWLRRNNGQAGSAPGRSAHPGGDGRRTVRRRIGPDFRAVRIDDGVEIPLRVEVERVVYQSNYVVKMERIF